MEYPKETHNHTPALRFPEFQNEGEWEVKRLGDVCQLTNGMAFKPSDWKETGIPIVRIQNLNDENAPFNYCTPETIDDRCMIDNGTLLFSWSGTPGTSFGAFIWNRGKAVLNQHIFVVNPVGIDKVFLKMTIDANMTSIIEKSHGGAGLRHITKSDFEDIRIYVPKELSEQQRIAIALSEFDTILSATKDKLEQLKAYKKGLMQKLFPAKDKTLPEFRFKEFEKDGGWEEKKLGEAVDVFQGYGFPERMQGKMQGKYPFIKVSDISTTVNNGRKYIDVANNYVDEEELSILGVTPFPIGTIIFAKIGEAIRLNRRVILSKPSLIDNNVGGVKAKDGLSNDDFVFYIMSMIDLVKYAGGVVPAVKKTVIENIEVLMPPTLYEQQRIADCFGLIDEMINQYTNKVRFLEVYKKGLMQQMFSTSK